MLDTACGLPHLQTCLHFGTCQLQTVVLSVLPMLVQTLNCLCHPCRPFLLFEMWDVDQVGLNNGMGNPDDPTRADPILMMAKGFIPSVEFKDSNDPSSFYLSPYSALSDTVGYQLERPYMHIQTRSGPPYCTRLLCCQ